MMKPGTHTRFGSQLLLKCSWQWYVSMKHPQTGRLIHFLQITGSVPALRPLFAVYFPSFHNPVSKLAHRYSSGRNNSSGRREHKGSSNSGSNALSQDYPGSHVEELELEKGMGGREKEKMEIYTHRSFEVRTDRLPTGAAFNDEIHGPARGVDINAMAADDRGRRGNLWSGANHSSRDELHASSRKESHEFSRAPPMGPIPITGLNDADLNLTDWPLQESPRDKKQRRLQKEDKRFEIERNPFQEQRLTEAHQRRFGRMEPGSAATSLSDTTR
jgi:hypothetical protein